jgi:hypothetical protein
VAICLLFVADFVSDEINIKKFEISQTLVPQIDAK